MSSNQLPILLEPKELASMLDDPGIVIVDLCKQETYWQAHVPGAIHLDYKNIVTSRPPAMGYIPDLEHLGQLMSELGITPRSHVIAYDDEGGGKAARLTYTLDVIGHTRYSLLNGGLHAWAKEGYPLDATPATKPISVYQVNIHSQPIAAKEYIMSHLYDDAIQLIDARSAAEFSGSKKFAAKGGHIPGAKNLDWNELIDQQHNFRLKSRTELANIVKSRDLDQAKTTVVYCQTHHRSALLYFALKYMGFNDVKGYPGSWSEWGNSSDTPVELG